MHNGHITWAGKKFNSKILKTQTIKHIRDTIKKKNLFQFHNLSSVSTYNLRLV